MRRKKITWDVIFKDFKLHFPNLKNDVVHWRPYDYATIKLWFTDGRKAAYNFDNRKLIFIDV